MRYLNAQKVERELTPSMHLVRFAMAVLVAGEEVMMGDAAQIDNKASMAIEEARMVCMLKVWLE